MSLLPDLAVVEDEGFQVSQISFGCALKLSTSAFPDTS